LLDGTLTGMGTSQGDDGTFAIVAAPAGTPVRVAATSHGSRRQGAAATGRRSLSSP